MTEHPGFAVTLARLLDHRRLSGRELAVRAGLTDSEIRSVLVGGAPGERLLRRIAPALGFHAVDLFVLAGLEVPDDLAPSDAEASRWTPYMVMDAVRLPDTERRELLRLIRSLPQEERPTVFAPKVLAPLASSSGRVIRMLQYRNLGWTGIAKVLAMVTPTYLSASTYGVIGSGRKELTPRLVTDFAALLGIDARELATLTGVRLTEAPPPPAPEAVDASALLWEARRLSGAQARHVSELARSMRGDCRE
ncbi:hypothetical protein ACH4S8_34395 [Streptomyces sp. NPDC021080]|uniref:hypothetical protein n=1 Tax=Streptomyces sp. NPDC021080 TaxID=3365110 RepID=UPI0037AA2FF7